MEGGREFHTRAAVESPQVLLRLVRQFATICAPGQRCFRWRSGLLLVARKPRWKCQKASTFDGVVERRVLLTRRMSRIGTCLEMAGINAPVFCSCTCIAHGWRNQP
eukprot:6178364-Amphidinium_carterae.1